MKLCESYEEAQGEVNNIRSSLGIETLLKSNAEDGLETIAETDNEEQGDDEVSEGATAPITDDTGTEDETADHTPESDDEGMCLIPARKQRVFGHNIVNE